VAEHSLCAPRFDLDVDRHGLADAGHRLRRRREEQVEIAPHDWFGRDRPARAVRVVERRKQFDVKGDRLGHSMHRQVAENIASLWTGAFHAAAFECYLGKCFDIKKFRAAQVIVALFDARIDAAHINLRRDRGILRVLAIDFNPAAESREFAVGGAKELMHRETDG